MSTPNANMVAQAFGVDPSIYKKMIIIEELTHKALHKNRPRIPSDDNEVIAELPSLSSPELKKITALQLINDTIDPNSEPRYHKINNLTNRTIGETLRKNNPDLYRKVATQYQTTSNALIGKVVVQDLHRNATYPNGGGVSFNIEKVDKVLGQLFNKSNGGLNTLANELRKNINEYKNDVYVQYPVRTSQNNINKLSIDA